MLHIKLPKGKTADALCRVAARYEARDRCAIQDFNAKLEAWRKNMHAPQGANLNPPNGLNREFQDRARKLYKQAGACSASTGDVYISATLWDEIKGDYNA